MPAASAGSLRIGAFVSKAGTTEAARESVGVLNIGAFVSNDGAMSIACVWAGKKSSGALESSSGNTVPTAAPDSRSAR